MNRLLVFCIIMITFGSVLAQQPTEEVKELVRNEIVILPFVQIGEVGIEETPPPPDIEGFEVDILADISWLRNTFPIIMGLTMEKTHSVLVTFGDDVIRTGSKLGVDLKREVSIEDACMLARYMGCDAVVVGTYEKVDDSVRVRYALVGVEGPSVIREGVFEVNKDDIQKRVIGETYTILNALGVDVGQDVKKRIGDGFTGNLKAMRWTAKCIGLPITGQMIGFASKAIEEDAEFAYPYKLLGDAYMFEDDFRTADYNYDNAIRLDSSMPSFYLAKGVNYYREGKDKLSQTIILTKGFITALTELKENLESAPFGIDDEGFETTRKMLIEEIGLTLENGELTSSGLVEAMYSFKSVGANFKDELDMMGTLSKLERAFDELSKARQESKGKVPEPEEFIKAENAFNEALTIDPGYAIAYVRLAKIEEERDNRVKAIELLKKALSIDKVNSEALVMLGNNYWYYGATLPQWRKYFGLAIDAYKSALEIRPDMSVTHYNIASLYLKVEDAENAIYHFERFLELEPDSGKAEDIRKTIENLKKGKYK